MNEMDSNTSRPKSFSPSGLRKELTLIDAVAVVAGTIIGSGIFLLPSAIAMQISSLRVVLLVWVAGGALTIFGALSLAELGAMYPGTGLCDYLQKAYGPLPAFLYAWGLLAMIHSGSIAALAVAFALFAGGGKALSAILILALTAINCLGIRSGKLTQNLIAAAKLTGLAAMIALMWIRGSLRVPIAAAAPPTPLAGLTIALIAVLWAYEGWHVISFVAGELRAPQRDLPRALLIGTGLVMAIYLTATIGYYKTLTPQQIRGSDTVAALAMGTLTGPAGATAISALILVSLAGSLNGLIVSGPRVYYAMAREGLFPRPFGEVSERYRTPTFALLAQGVWTAALAVSGTYQQIFTDVIFTAWIFYGLAVAAVPLLRLRQPKIERPFRVPGYPWASLLFCAAALGLVAGAFVQQPGRALTGIGLIACGVPVYFFARRREARQ